MRPAESKPATRPATLNGRLKLVLPSSGAAEVHILITVLEVIAVQQRYLQSGSAQSPFGEIDPAAADYFRIDSVVHIEQRNISVAINLHSTRKLVAVPPVVVGI